MDRRGRRAQHGPLHAHERVGRELTPTPPHPARSDVDRAVARLGLRPEGAVRSTTASLVVPVRTADDVAAFLKLTNAPDELLGALALDGWNGHGAVRVLLRDGTAVVLERAGSTLRAHESDDAVATRVLVDVAARLHAATPADASPFPPLAERFASLLDDRSPAFDEQRSIARRLLAQDGPTVLLHGDLHHENVLDGGDRGWLAIDPQPAVGPAAFDYGNLFTNWTLDEARRHFDARVAIVTAATGLDRRHLLEWIAAWSALSGIWHLEDGDLDEAAFPHAVSALALERLAALDGVRTGTGRSPGGP